MERKGQMFVSQKEMLSAEEIVGAQNDWERIHRLIINTRGMQHAPCVRKHLDEGKHIVGFFTHQAHPDFFMTLRVMNYFTDNKIAAVGGPASSKLYPGGELYEKEGRKMRAFEEVLNIKFFKMVQHYNHDGGLGDAKTNFKAFSDIRKMFEEEKSVYIGYSFEGGRGNGDGVLRAAQDGTELLFANRIKNNTNQLADNDSVLGIPINLGDTQNILDKKGKINYARVWMPFRVHIGQPFLAKDVLWDMEQFGHSFSDVIGARVASLTAPRYRGYYGSGEFANFVSYAKARNTFPYTKP
jgi:hypothetical protein